MTMYEQNREYVLRGLALREVKRNEEAALREEAARDAALDAAEREMHREINFRTRWNGIEKKAAQAAELRDKETAERRAAIQAKEKKATENLNLYMRRMGIALIIAAAMTILFSIEAVSLWLELTVIALAGVWSIANYAAYAVWVKKSQ